MSRHEDYRRTRRHRTFTEINGVMVRLATRRKGGAGSPTVVAHQGVTPRRGNQIHGIPVHYAQ